MFKKTFYSVIVTFFLSNILHAQPSDPNLDILVLPEFVNMKPPKYPSKAISSSSEGWVFLNFMVDTDGKIFEPVVIDSVGDSRFKRSAINALKKSKIKPAYLNGEPIISSSFYRYIFSISDGSGASNSFIKKYKLYSNEVESGNQAELAALLDELISQNGKLIMRILF